MNNTSPPIYDKIKCGYDVSTYSYMDHKFNTYFSVNHGNVQNANIISIRNVDKPKSEYHTWLKNTSIDKAKIYVYCSQQILNTQNKANKEKKTVVKKKIKKKTQKIRYPLIRSEDNADELSDSNISSNSDEKLNPDIDTIESLFASLHTHNIKIEFNNDVVADVLQWCDKLRYFDKDERKLNKSILQNIPVITLRNKLKNMVVVANDLLQSIRETVPEVNSMNMEDKYNFLFHIIAKGTTFYKAVKNDPTFSMYLLSNQYQNLFTLMKDKTYVSNNTLDLI